MRSKQADSPLIETDPDSQAVNVKTGAGDRARAVRDLADKIGEFAIDPSDFGNIEAFDDYFDQVAERPTHLAGLLKGMYIRIAALEAELERSRAGK